MEFNALNVLGVLGFMGIYIALKVWVYSREYKEDTKDKVLKRGSEWD
jgi:cbb3-type cytochrome oxidase subunit 3